ncbi:MAG: hypothetical protein KGD64_06840 [Candidatus Heimdallarchaeota archaeon]|nr:hypothetical protein [Candidatus Heimdallarchaeota archaeon]
MKEEKQDDLEHLGRNPVVTTLWIGFAVSLLGIVGLITFSLIIDEYLYFRIALGILAIGVLIISFAFILRRIRKKGLDYFVAGAVTAYIGFLLFALPIILIAILTELPGEQFWYIISMGVGVVFIGFGFLMETYELNKKLIALLKSLKETFVKILKRIKWKIVFSPWNLFSVVGITVIVLTALNILPFLDNLYYYIIGGVLIVINILIHLRQEIWDILKDIGRVISTILRAWGRALKQIPRIIKEAGIWFYEKTSSFFKLIGRALKYIIVKNYFLLFGLGIAMFFLLSNFALEIRIATSSLVCLVAIVKPILDWRDFFGEKISTARQYLYKTTQKTRNALKYRKNIRCPYCSFPNPFLRRECWQCKKEIPRCMICNNTVEKEATISVCPHCENIYHVDHLKTWIRFNPKCPVCHNEIKSIKTEIFQPEEG